MSADLIALRPTPLDVAEAVSHVTTPDAGGIDVFIGTTRHDADPTLGPLVALDYEAYDDMAVAEIRRILSEARSRWPIVRAAVLHRTGRVPVGYPSVIIAVSTPHRAEAFAACRYIIDELKSRAPIWKNDVYERSARWRHDAPAPPNA